MQWSILILAIVLVSVCFAVPVAGAVPSELPLTRIVLFSSGVASFEHTGRLDGDATVKMFFTTDQMNDVLKSMVVNDLDGGHVAGIGYASRDPLLRALKSFGVDISDDPTLANLLKRLRGADVILHAPDRISGKILNVEKRTKREVLDGETLIYDTHTINLVVESGIQPVAMESVTQIRFADDNLENELHQAIDLLAQSMDTDKRALEIAFRGEGSRRVRVAYILEAPVWKTSYRLDLSGETPLIQGWGIVENASDSDWQAVKLDLVSGQPISFIQDLYTPIYVERPEVKPDTHAAVKPRKYEEGIDLPAPAPSAKPEKKSMVRMAAMAEAPAEFGQEAEGAALDTGVTAAAQGEKAGELFHFALEEPVDLMRRQSAMLPIVNTAIEVEKISIYNASTSTIHPMNGAILTNTTGLKLPPGPITVFDAGAYAGDGRIDTLVPQAKKLIGYAVDLDVTVDPTMEQKSRRAVAKMVKGVLWEKQTQTFRQIYHIRNKSDQDRRIIVEHPFRANRKLVSPETFEEKTPRHYRFRRELAAGEKEAFTVIEERVVAQQVALGNLPVNRLLWYIQSDDISPGVKEALQVAANLRQELAALEHNRKDLQNQINTIDGDQTRIRDNLKSAGKDTQLGKRYLQKLSQQEDQLEEIQASLATLRQEITAKRNEYDAYLNGLKIE
jgi:hypothetical protein